MLDIETAVKIVNKRTMKKVISVGKTDEEHQLHYIGYIHPLSEWEKERNKPKTRYEEKVQKAQYKFAKHSRFYKKK